jgi:hypothetical protein
MYRDTITIYHFVVKADGFVVNRDQIDFVMRDSEHFNRVLDRRLTAIPIGNGLFVMLVSDEIIEFFVAAKLAGLGFQLIIWVSSEAQATFSNV